MKFTSKMESSDPVMQIHCGNELCNNNLNVPLTIILSGKGEVKCDICGHTTSLEGSSQHESP